jgi:uncharacterized protein (TIGR02145 family)
MKTSIWYNFLCMFFVIFSFSGCLGEEEGGGTISISISATSADNPEGNSGNTAFTFIVDRNGVLSGGNDIDYQVSGSSENPASAEDFGGSFPSGTLSFKIGDTTQVITINVNGDTDLEPDETFIITLSNATNNAVITTDKALGTILNDDINLTILATTTEELEGNSGNNTFSFVVNRGGKTNSSNDVDYAVTGKGNNPADADDFGGTFPRGSVSFSSGDTTQIINIKINGDTSLEPDETFVVTLSNATNDATITTATATSIIQTDDPYLIIAAASTNKDEGDSGVNEFTYTVTREGYTSLVSTVDWAVTGSGNNAANLSDFIGNSLPSGTLTFNKGDKTKTITVSVSGDTALEPDDTFTVTLSNPSNTQITTSSVTSTIISDDAGLSVTAISADKNEGDSGTTDFTFSVTRAGGLSYSTSVNYTVIGVSSNPANGTDFSIGSLPSGTLNFAAEQILQVISLGISGDLTYEPDEAFVIALFGAGANTVITTETASGNIQSDDTSLEIIASSADKAEGDSGSSGFTFTVTRNGGISNSTTVDYVVTGTTGHPADSTDFGGSFPSGIISFSAGEPQKIITINISGDNTVENDEGFTVTLSNPSSPAIIETSSASGVIRNNDKFLVISSTSADKDEGDSGLTPFTFKVIRTGDITGSTNVGYAVTGTGASPANGADFSGTLPTGTITFAASDTEEVITINASGDTLVEDDEGFIITLSNTSDNAVIATDTAVGNIRNEDTSLSISATSADKNEEDSGNTAYTFTVTRSGYVNEITNVNYAVTGSGNNAANEIDFGGSFPSGILTFAENDQNKVITINITGDSDFEFDNGFTVTLSGADNGAILINDTASGMIKNDDTASFSINDVKNYEDQNAEFTIFLTGTIDIQITMNYSTVSTSSAESGSDYNDKNGTITFNSGDTQKTISVTVINDTIDEANETFGIDLSSLSAGTLTDNQGIATITDNDSEPTVIFTESSQTLTEGEISTITCELSTKSGLDVSIPFSVTGSATSGDDYSAMTSSPVTISAGSTTANITFSTTNDHPATDDGETVILTMGEPTYAIKGATVEHTVTINDYIVPTVMSAGQEWMDRNLGASRVATSYNDSEAYGDLYQWGRGADGHEKRTSNITTTSSSSDNPGHGFFIRTNGALDDWRDPQNKNLWQGESGINNPCPSGFRVPTKEEWQTERSSWSSDNFNGAFSSPLKLVVGGYRPGTGGDVEIAGDNGIYWSSTVDGSRAFQLDINNNYTIINTTIRSDGESVRCIKDKGDLSISPTSADKPEGNSGNTAFTFTITRGGDTTGSTDVDYAVTGTGENPADASDFGGSLPSGTVSFSSGDTTKVITINVNGDTNAEENEVFTVTLSNATNRTLILSSTADGTIQNDDYSGYSTVMSAGQEWIDRNLGASQVATSFDDSDAYGDLYQWGRGSDGHEKRTSITTSTVSTSDTPAHGNFINPNEPPNNWRNPENINLWQGVSGINNPCPVGSRLPTVTELRTELSSWSSNNSAEAFASPLKLVVAGARLSTLYLVGSRGFYWSSTIGSSSYASFLNFGNSSSVINGDHQAIGRSVRCIKD